MMKKNLLFGFLAVVMLALTSQACKSDPKDATNTEATEASSKGNKPDPATGGKLDASIPEDVANDAHTSDQPLFSEAQQNEGLMKLLEGQWKNMADQTEGIEFRGTQVIYYKNGNQSGSSTFKIDSGCSNSPCKDIKKRAPGWCLVENGTCKSVTRLDMSYLIIQPSDGSAGKTEYKRVSN